MRIFCNIGKGRRVSADKIRVNNAVEGFLLSVSDTFTLRDITRKTKTAKADTRAAVARLERLGIVAKVGDRLNGLRGRPAAIWARV